MSKTINNIILLFLLALLALAKTQYRVTTSKLEPRSIVPTSMESESASTKHSGSRTESVNTHESQIMDHSAEEEIQSWLSH